MNTVNSPAQESFLRDVADHQMIVSHDDGVRRHITFKRLGSSCYAFSLVTWPGYLAYTGDMGSFMFCRLPDMFDFFRMNPSDWNFNKTGGLSINPGYWAEKLVSTDRNGGHKKFDPERFKQVIHEYRLDWVRSDRGRALTKEQRRELWEAAGDVMNVAEDGYQKAGQAAHDFSYRFDNSKHWFEFTDLFDHNFDRPTYHFVWCCYALAWGIKQYDAAKANATLEPAS